MDKGIDNYIKGQKSPQKEILNELRKIILKTFPGINEEMLWGAPCYGIDSSGKCKCAKFYIVGLKDHVNIGFSMRGLTGKKKELFEGTGKTMRHIKIRSLKDIDEKGIVKLMKLVK